jgi:hypothetical protein
MRLNTTTSLNDCIKRVSDGDVGAASVMALLTKDYSDSAMKWIHSLDTQEVYGKDIWIGFNDVCNHNIEMFFKLLSDRKMKAYVAAWKQSK